MYATNTMTTIKTTTSTVIKSVFTTITKEVKQIYNIPMAITSSISPMMQKLDDIKKNISSENEKLKQKMENQHQEHKQMANLIKKFIQVGPDNRIKEIKQETRDIPVTKLLLPKVDADISKMELEEAKDKSVPALNVNLDIGKDYFK
jgi:septal ring factor EnvC (AmiA/AmiB activator)